MPSPACGYGCFTAGWLTGSCWSGATTPITPAGWVARPRRLAEPVLTTEIRRLVDAVAARYAGTRPDVLRLAVPARHARVEREPTTTPARPVAAPVDPSGWQLYGRGGPFLAALAESRAARAFGRRCRLSPGRAIRRGRRPNRPGRPFGAGGRPRSAGPGRAVAGRDARIDENSAVALSAGLGPAARTGAGWPRCEAPRDW